MTELAPSELAPRPARISGTSAAHKVLRSPLTVLGATLASFLVVLALLTARVTSGQEQALPAGANTSSVLVVHRGGKILRTTASGRVLGPARSPAAREGGSQTGAQPAALVTHTSGARGTGEQDD